MDEKKDFFSSLEPKSALIVGVVGGILVLGTIGFIVMLVMTFHGGINLASAKSATTTDNTANANQGNTTPTPTVVKADKPVVDLFVMAYCPYGLQMEKAFLPVWSLLKNKASLDIKFVYYSMHGLKEIQENTRQYCIDKEQNDKYIAYLQCFTGKDDYKACLAQAKVNESKLNACTASTDKQFSITAKYNDQSTWLSGQYPLYPIYDALNKQYSIGGSPTLIINGAEASANRTPEAVKEAICASFNNAPSECQQKLSDAATSPGFGTATGGSGTAAAGCATN